LTAAENQLHFAQEQYQAGIADQTAEMVAKSKVEELEAVLAALEPSNNIAPPNASANLTMGAPAPPEAPAPATPPTPPASPAPFGQASSPAGAPVSP
jgi:outer membrane protein TolC